MQKTPEEIKRGLGYCADGIDCSNACPYHADCLFGDDEHVLEHDALAYIQQLERERDELMHGIKKWGGICAMCKHYSTNEYDPPCSYCYVLNPNEESSEECWEWRGVEEDDP